MLTLFIFERCRSVPDRVLCGKRGGSGEDAGEWRALLFAIVDLDANFYLHGFAVLERGVEPVL